MRMHVGDKPNTDHTGHTVITPTLRHPPIYLSPTWGALLRLIFAAIDSFESRKVVAETRDR